MTSAYWEVGSFVFSLLGEVALWRRIIHGSLAFSLAEGAPWWRVRVNRRPLAEREVPNKAMWCIWAIANGSLAILASETGGPFWQIIAYTIGAAAIATYAVAMEGPGFEDEDRWLIVPACILTLATITVWWVSTDETLAIALNLAIFFVGARPLAREKLKDPWAEGKLAWWLFFAGGACSMYGMLLNPAQAKWPGDLIDIGCFALQSCIVGLCCRRPTGDTIPPAKSKPTLLLYRNLHC